MAGYEGAPGTTRRQGIHYACPCGVLFGAQVVVAIDAKSDPELAAELLRGGLNRLSCLVCGAPARAEVPVLFHDPEAKLLALVLPEWARIRELDERALLLAGLASDCASTIPPYAKSPIIVYGAAGLGALVSTRSRLEASASATATPSAPLVAEASARRDAHQGAVLPVWTSQGEETVCLLERGRVRLCHRRPVAELERLAHLTFTPRLMLHRMDGFPLVVLAALPASASERALIAPLDARAGWGRQVLRALGMDFRFDLELCDPQGRVVAKRQLAAPLEENARLIASTVQETAAGSSRAGGSYRRAVEAFLAPTYERLGRRRHNFSETSFQDLRSPSATRMAVGILSYWCEPEHEAYLLFVQALPLPVWRPVRSRVARAAIDLGIALPRPLAEQAVDEGWVASQGELLERQLGNFAEVSLHLKPNDLDAPAEWENWSALLAACEPAGVLVDSQLRELARAAARRAAQGAEERGSADGPLGERVSAVGDAAEGDLLRMVRQGEGQTRCEAALELLRREGTAEHLEAIFSVLDKMTRGEVSRLLVALTRAAAPTEPLFVAGLGSCKSFVRQGCALALGARRSEQAAGPLVQVMLSEPTHIWKELARALGDIGVPAVARLVNGVDGADRDGRERLAFALAYVAVRGGRAELDPLLGSEDPSVRQLAFRALALLSEARAADEEVRGAEPPRETTVVRSLTRRFYRELASSPQERRSCGKLSGFFRDPGQQA